MILVGLVSIAVVTLATAAQAVTGFGSALVAVPLLALVVDPVAAVVGMTTLSTVMTAMAAVRERDHVVGALVWRFSLTGLLGLPLGLLVLTALSPRHLTLLVAMVLGVLVVLLAAGVRVPAGPVAQGIAGVAGGALLTSTGMNGPPLVVTLQAMGLPPRPFRATLQGIFVVQDVMAVVGFAIVGSIDRVALLLAAAGVLGIPLGWWLGDRVFHAMSAETFRRVVLVGLGATTLVALVKAFA